MKLSKPRRSLSPREQIARYDEAVEHFVETGGGLNTLYASVTPAVSAHLANREREERIREQARRQALATERKKRHRELGKNILIGVTFSAFVSGAVGVIAWATEQTAQQQLRQHEYEMNQTTIENQALQGLENVNAQVPPCFTTGQAGTAKFYDLATGATVYTARVPKGYMICSGPTQGVIFLPASTHGK